MVLYYGGYGKDKMCFNKADGTISRRLYIPENTYFIVDLIDIEVYTDDGTLLGKIVDVFPTRKQ